MRRIFGLIIVSIMSVSLLSFFADANSNVGAQTNDISQAQVERIQANCLSIKNSLNQLHASDALLRVNRGQNYETIASKLMDNFNNRLGSNGLDNKAMTTVTTNYRLAFDDFRNDYISYEQKLSETIRIDCNQQPRTFHKSLLEARELRSKVHNDVLKLHRQIDDYRMSVGDFLLNYEKVAE